MKLFVNFKYILPSVEGSKKIQQKEKLIFSFLNYQLLVFEMKGWKMYGSEKKTQDKTFSSISLLFFSFIHQVAVKKLFESVSIRNSVYVFDLLIINHSLFERFQLFFLYSALQTVSFFRFHKIELFKLLFLNFCTPSFDGEK